MYDDQQSYHATSMRQSFAKNQYEMVEYMREQSQMTLDEYDKAVNEINFRAEGAKKQHNKPNTRKSVRFKEQTDPIVAQ